MKSKFQRTELRLPKILHSKIKKHANKKGLSFNQYVRFAIQEKLENEIKAQASQD